MQGSQMPEEKKEVKLKKKRIQVSLGGQRFTH